MRSVRRSIQVVLVWLTAVTTLIASVPHFNCVCPNGNQKQFCFLSLSSSGAGCCCGGSCCAIDSVKKCCDQGGLAAGSQGEQTCCCCETKGQSKPQAPANDTQFDGRSCTKTLASGESVVAPAKECNEQDSSGLSVPTSPLIPLRAVSPVPCLSMEVYQLPPPTDLVITLKHFII